ncbi:MAG: group III truncated hemoglobin, partial [Saprospiraceae bacterium]
MTKEILRVEDVQLLVHSFYDKIRLDAMLGPIFNSIIEDRWPEHLDRMVRFWQTVLLDEHTYSGSPFMKHAQLPVGKEHFDQWLSLFFETVDKEFSGAKAEEAKLRAQKMAEMFQYKLEYIRTSGSKPLV